MTIIHVFTFEQADHAELDINMMNFIEKNNITRKDIIKIYFYATVVPRLSGVEGDNIIHYGKLVFESKKDLNDLDQDDVNK